jgi:uncharacterized membrane protein YjgN (DUF898 family)
MLSIVTLGFYSPWAKVRREQYFHRNTLLDGSGFDYHGDPKAILKGRIIAVVLFTLLGAVDRLAHDYYLWALLAASPLVPWLTIRSLAFRSRNTSYRGLRFGFLGTYAGFCGACLLPLLGLAVCGALTILMGAPLLVGLSFYEYASTWIAHPAWVPVRIAAGVGLFLLIPVLMRQFKTFQFNHLAFGATRFEARFSVKSFAWLGLRCLLLLILFILVVIVPFYLQSIHYIQLSRNEFMLYMGLAAALAYILLFFLLPAWYKALMANLTWNDTRLGRHAFRSDQKLGGVFWIAVSNWLLTLLTLGFFWPWAKTRMARYRAEHMAVLVSGGLDDFIAGESRSPGAAGEEIADIFDFDIGF